MSYSTHSSQKNGTDDQNDRSISSSSSSSKTSTSCDNEKSKTLKSLIKKKINPNQDFIKSHNKRVKFSETMQVFCYELPDNQMPQIIALKSPADLNLMEFPSYMFEPPAEYQDFLTFEPPPDYRDFIANSLNVYRNEVTFDYIDDDGDDDSESISGYREVTTGSAKNDNNLKDRHISSVVINNDSNQNSNWKSMILDNNLDSLEEEQIIGVLKEDEILQAIGSQISLPVISDHPNGSVNSDRISDDDDDDVDSKTSYTFEVVDGHGHFEENLSSEDFPVHHLNSYLYNSSPNIDDDDEDACCIDSSPNGSLHDLASDSSITSQDTIILINQNKTFHLESLNHSAVSNDQVINVSASENIYENIQQAYSNNSNNNNVNNCNNNNTSNNNNIEINVSSLINQLSNGNAINEPNATLGQTDKPAGNCLPDKSEQEYSQPSDKSVDVLYENTSQILMNTVSNNSMLANHLQNFENRFSTSSSEDSKISVVDSRSNSTLDCSNPNNNNNINFKQNLMFYEGIIQPSNQNTAAQANSNKQQLVMSENDRPMAVNVQRKYPINIISNNDINHVVVSGSNIPHQFPLYSIVENSRTSSSSSLSSTSSSSTSLVSSSNSNQPSQTLTSIASNTPSTSTPQIQSQLSPSSNSSSSSSSNMQPQHSDYVVQYGTTPRTIVPTKRISSLNESIPPGSNSNLNPTNNVPSFVQASPHNESNMNAFSQSSSHSNATPTVHSQSISSQQPQICIVNNVGSNKNGNVVVPGQVVYRYPYAFIQQQGTNGVSTLRPVQYIVQTNPNTGAQSVIYNPRFIINNNQQAPASTCNVANPALVNNHNGGVSNGNGLPVPNPINAPQRVPVPCQAHIMTSNSQSVSPTPVPIRHIIVPQGTTVLAPRIMHLHPHHHKQAPPPYQYYVQQKQQQQAQLFAYQHNVQLRFGTPSQLAPNDGQMHTEFPNPSEIRRRDGLYAYPQVLLKTDDSNSSQSTKPGENCESSSEDKDELEEFVQKEQQRTERIKKRYSFTEEDDPTFGFGRRPSVRGIRPKFGSTNEIIHQMTSTMPRHLSQQKIIVTGNNVANHQLANAVFVEKPAFAAYGTLPKNAQFIQVNTGKAHQGHPQMISIVKQMGDIRLTSENCSPQNIQLKSQTLPRQLSQVQKGKNVELETVRLVDASLFNGPTGNGDNSTLSRDQLKLQLQKQLERQIHQQQKSQPHRTTMPNQAAIGLRPLVNDERGVPEGASFSPNHPVAGGDSTLFSPNNVTKESKVGLVNNESIKQTSSNDDVFVVNYSLNV